MWYGKVVPEFFQGNVASDTFLLSMLIRVDKHPELMGALRLASTLAVSVAANVAQVVPTVRVLDVDEGPMKAALEINLNAPILLRERKCPSMLPR